MVEPAVGDWALGCQARPWALGWGPEDFARRLPEVMAQIAAIGFTGFETRLAHLPLDDPGGFTEAARATGLSLCGAHVGGKWWSPEGAASIPAIAAQARRLPALGCRRLVVSGGVPAGATREQIAGWVETLGRLGRACREAGDVRVVFHNHAGEVADDARLFRALVEGCAPADVMLGPDLGWVALAGMAVPAFLRRFGSRIAYLHLRDVTACGPEGQLVEVGRGILDYPAILDALSALDYRGWLVVESEVTAADRATDPRETTRAQFHGLRAALDAAGLDNRVRRAPRDTSAEGKGAA